MMASPEQIQELRDKAKFLRQHLADGREHVAREEASLARFRDILAITERELEKIEAMLGRGK
jgi:hypothetical protein